MAPEAEIGVTLLRVALGLMIAAHGAQKVFGWFGGKGFAGVLKLVDGQRMRPRRLWAVTVCACELGAALLIALGLLTPLAVGLLGAEMIIVARKHAPNGFFNLDGGMEFPLLILTVLGTLLLTGPGPYSLDALLGLDALMAGPLVRLAAVAMAVTGPLVALASRAPAESQVAGHPG